MRARIEEGGNGFPAIGDLVLHGNGEVYRLLDRGRIQTEQYKANWMIAEFEEADWDELDKDADLGVIFPCSIGIIEDEVQS